MRKKMMNVISLDDLIPMSWMNIWKWFLKNENFILTIRLIIQNCELMKCWEHLKKDLALPKDGFL